MSTEWTECVWTHSKQKGSAKLLLLAIAHVADETGSTTALSIAALEHLVGTKERNMQLLLAKLEQAGELRREFGVGPFGRTRYTLCYSPIVNPPTVQQPAPVHAAPPVQSPAPELRTPAPSEDATAYTPLKKEGSKEGEESPTLARDLYSDTDAAAGEPPLPADPLLLWRTVRTQTQPLDTHQLHLLVAEHDASTDGRGAYWLGRAILAAVATDPAFATNPRALNLVRAILSRWQREQAYGSDTQAYQRRAERPRTSAPPVVVSPIPATPPQPTERAVWRTATTAHTGTTSPPFRIATLE